VTTLTKPSSLVQVRPGEGRLVLLLLAHTFLIGCARIFTRTAGYALFLAQFDARALPYVYIAISIFAALASFGYLKLSERLSVSKLSLAAAAFLALATFGLRAALGASRAGWLVFLLPVWYEVMYTLSNLEFWNLAGRLCDVRQGKRLFGVIGAGEQIAAIIGGFLVPLLVVWIGTPNLLLLAALAFGGVLAVLVVTGRLFGRPLAAPARPERPGEELGTAAVSPWRDRYIVLLFSAFGLMIFSYFFIDNIFYAQASLQYPGEDQLAAFIGPFFAVISLLTLISQTLLTGRLFNRFGVRAALLISPVGLALLAGSSIAAGIGLGAALFFWMLALLKLFNLTAIMSVDEPVFKILYQPLPSGGRVRAMTVVEGFIYPLAIGLAGLALTVLTGPLGLKPVPLLGVLLFILAAWLALGILLGRQYFAVLMGALQRRRLSAVSVAIDDASNREVLRRALASPNPGVVLYALRMLEEGQPDALPAVLPGLLDHPEPEVRQAALEQIEGLRLEAALPAVRERLSHDPSTAVRAAALRALAALGGMEGVCEVCGFLADPDPQVSVGAMAALLCSSEGEPLRTAELRVRELAADPDPGRRIQACKALGEGARWQDDRLLQRLLDDPDLGVRRAALAAAGKLAWPPAWPAAVDALAHPRLRRTAVVTLAGGGEAALPAIEAAFGRPETDRSVPLGLTQACGRIGGERAAGLLLGRIAAPDDALRSCTLDSLRHCRYRPAGDEPRLLQQQIQFEIAHAAGLLTARLDLERPDAPPREDGSDAAVLLADALRELAAGTRRRLLLLLAFLYDSPKMLQAGDRLLFGSAEQRAYALEVIDILLPSELKRGVMPLLENLPPQQQLQRLSALVPQARLDPAGRLRTLLLDPEMRDNPWLLACACHAVGALGLADLAGCLPRADGDPLVRETAGWAIARLNGEKRMLSTLEKVIILKAADLFSGTPDEVLAEVAAVSREAEVKAGEAIFHKGDPGDCMYFVVSGRLRAHDGQHTLNTLGQGDIFGEMAILDPQPRMASITALEDALLLRLDQEALYELMEERPEVARGIIRVLSRRLRDRVQDLHELRDQMNTAPGAVPNQGREGSL
jgi:ATP:ADP antiporter, AAA family